MLGHAGDLLGMDVNVDGSKRGFDEHGEQRDAQVNCMRRKLESFDRMIGNAKASMFSTTYYDKITPERVRRRFPYTFGMVTNLVDYLRKNEGAVPLRVVYTVSDDPTDIHGLGRTSDMKRRGIDGAAFIKLGKPKGQNYEETVSFEGGSKEPVFYADDIRGYETYLSNLAELSKEEAYLGPEGVLDLCREYDWLQRTEDGSRNRILKKGKFTEEEAERGLETLYERITRSIQRLEDNYDKQVLKKTMSYGLLRAEKENTLKLINDRDTYSPGFYIGQSYTSAMGPFLEVMEEAVRNISKDDRKPVYNWRRKLFGVSPTEPQAHEGFLTPGDMPNSMMFAEKERKAIREPKEYVLGVIPRGRLTFSPQKYEEIIRKKFPEFAKLFPSHRNK